MWPINEQLTLYRRQLQLEGPAFGSAQNMELMRNFVERTSLAVDLVADGDPVWQREAVQASALSPFLQHALMALSSLHICHENPPDSYSQSYHYYDAACWHSVRASELFRANVYSIDQSNWQPVLIFLIASIIFSLDMLLLDQAMDTGLSKHPPISPASFLLIMRRPGSLSKQLISKLVSGSLSMTLLHRQYKFQTLADGQVIYAINSLYDFCTANMSSGSNAETYHDTVKSLKLWAEMVSCRPQSWNGLVGWPVMVSERYIQLLGDGDEFAAVVFCYWCAVMNRAPKRYYLVGVMKKLEVAATAGLNAEWEPLLQWPRKELQSM
jgi:hypothetical protein